MGTGNKKGIVLFGAGSMGEKAMWHYGAHNVYCFADNFKHGNFFFGKKVISPGDLQKISNEYEIIISARPVLEAEISEQLKSAGINFRRFSEDRIDYQRSAFDVTRLKIFKNTYENQAIFLIGNGPSLAVSDLEKIQANNIKTFACNLIFKIFDKTAWRPDFYCCIENSAIATSMDFIRKVPLTAKFIKAPMVPDLQGLFNGEKMPDDVFFYVADTGLTGFSQDVSYVVYDGGTVMYAMIEFAVYMGFKTIYLLGVENTQPPTVYTTDFIERHAHFYEEDKTELEKRRKIMKYSKLSDDWTRYQGITTKSYNAAKTYADEHGINIFNATRGGKLEVFERVDFDKLF